MKGNYANTNIYQSGFYTKIQNIFCDKRLAFEKKFIHLPRQTQARMAESVDALVSNTSRFTPVPVRPRLRVHPQAPTQMRGLALFLIVCTQPPQRQKSGRFSSTAVTLRWHKFGPKTPTANADRWVLCWLRSA